MPSHDYTTRLEQQLDKRLRLAWAMLAAGILIGFIVGAVIAMPPLWLGAL